MSSPVLHPTLRGNTESGSPIAEEKDFRPSTPQAKARSTGAGMPRPEQAIDPREPEGPTSSCIDRGRMIAVASFRRLSGVQRYWPATRNHKMGCNNRASRKRKGRSRPKSEKDGFRSGKDEIRNKRKDQL